MRTTFPRKPFRQDTTYPSNETTYGKSVADGWVIFYNVATRREAP